MNIYITRRIKIYESFSKFDFSPNYRLKNLFTKLYIFFIRKDTNGSIHRSFQFSAIRKTLTKAWRQMLEKLFRGTRNRGNFERFCVLESFLERGWHRGILIRRFLLQRAFFHGITRAGNETRPPVSCRERRVKCRTTLHTRRKLNMRREGGE